MKEEWYELSAIANAALRWAEHGYIKERYEKVLKASARAEDHLPE